MDLLLFRAVNDVAGDVPVLDAVAVFFASQAEYVIGAALLLAFFWPGRDAKLQRKAVVVSALAAIVARFAVTEVLKFIVQRPRPFLALENVHLLIQLDPREYFLAFPSGHATVFFALATALFFFHRRLGAIAFGVATLISVARVYVGVHWPSDILVGAVLGLVVGFVTQRVALLLLGTGD